MNVTCRAFEPTFELATISLRMSKVAIVQTARLLDRSENLGSAFADDRCDETDFLIKTFIIVPGAGGSSPKITNIPGRGAESARSKHRRQVSILPRGVQQRATRSKREGRSSGD